MREPVHFIPILTTFVALPFAIVLFRRWRGRPASIHLLWWSAGVLLYGVGTATEAATTLFGWHEPIFSRLVHLRRAAGRRPSRAG